MGINVFSFCIIRSDLINRAVVVVVVVIAVYVVHVAVVHAHVAAV